MNNPERIFAWRWKLNYPSASDGRPSWNYSVWPAGQEASQYIRLDLLTNLADSVVEYCGCPCCASHADQLRKIIEQSTNR
jgi:hypothetical protein